MGLFDFLKSKGETENSPRSENISFNGVCETPVNAKYTPDVISTDTVSLSVSERGH